MAGSKNEVLMAIISDPPIKMGEQAQRCSVLLSRELSWKKYPKEIFWL